MHSADRSERKHNSLDKTISNACLRSAPSKRTGKHTDKLGSMILAIHKFDSVSDGVETLDKIFDRELIGKLSVVSIHTNDESLGSWQIGKIVTKVADDIGMQSLSSISTPGFTFLEKVLIKKLSGSIDQNDDMLPLPLLLVSMKCRLISRQAHLARLQVSDSVCELLLLIFELTFQLTIPL